MVLFNLVLKSVILALDLRNTYDALDAVKLDQIGRSERQVLVRNAQDGTKQLTTRKRVGTSKRKAAVKSALTTVLIWNLFHKMEPLCDRTIAWFVPFYDSFKTLFLIWMLFTRSYGASILVYRFLSPMVRPYEPIIDAIFGLTLTLLTWTAARLTLITGQCALVVDRIGAVIRQAPQSEQKQSASDGHSEAAQRKVSTSSIVEQARNKPLPPPSPASVKNSPASVASFLAETATLPQSRAGTTKAHQEPTKKASQSNLAATRRVLQELPVPRHAFDPIVPQSSVSATASTSNAGVTTSQLNLTNANIPSIKAEPAEPSLAPHYEPLGPPPTPPTGLHNYAFIPGLTPQRSGPASLASPTPRFPGGFSFSFAVPRVCVQNGADPYLAQARVPATTQMAPLSVSSSQAPLARSSLLGLTNGGANSILTHESVASAEDDRIVPPPSEVAGVRKVSSARSLKSKAAAVTTMSDHKAGAPSNGKKRTRSDEVSKRSVDETGKLLPSSSSPRKRAKSAAGKVASSKTASGSVTAKSRAEAKSTSATRLTATTRGTVASRKKAAASVTNNTTEKSIAPKSTAGATVAEGKLEDSSMQSPEKVDAPSRKPKTGLATTTTQRTVAKKDSSLSKSRGQFVNVGAAESVGPPQRLTRSRTRKNLVD